MILILFFFFYVYPNYLVSAVDMDCFGMAKIASMPYLVSKGKKMVNMLSKIRYIWRWLTPIKVLWPPNYFSFIEV